MQNIIAKAIHIFAEKNDIVFATLQDRNFTIILVNNFVKLSFKQLGPEYFLCLDENICTGTY